MLRRELLECAVERWEHVAGCEHVPLEPLAGFEHPRRDCGAGMRRRCTGLDLDRHAELVIRVPPGVLALGRVREAVEQLLDPLEAALPVLRALELEPDAVAAVALRADEPLLEPGRIVGRVRSWRQRHDTDLEATVGRKLHPP